MMNLTIIKNEALRKASSLIDDNDIELDIRFQFEKEVCTGNPSTNYEFGIETKNIACLEENATHLRIIPSVNGYTSIIVFSIPIFYNDEQIIDIIANELWFTHLNMSE